MASLGGVSESECGESGRGLRERVWRVWAVSPRASVASLGGVSESECGESGRVSESECGESGRALRE